MMGTQRGQVRVMPGTRLGRQASPARRQAGPPPRKGNEPWLMRPPESVVNSTSRSSHRGSLLYYQDNTVLSEILYLVYLMSKQLPKDLSIKPVNLTGEMRQLALPLWLRGLRFPLLQTLACIMLRKPGNQSPRRGLKVGAIKQRTLSPRLPQLK